MKRVLFFTHHLSGGGAEKCVRTIADYFYKNKEEYQIDPYIAVVYDDPEIRKELQQVIVLKYRSNPEDGKVHKAWNVLRQAYELKKLKRALQIDVCVSFLPGADFLNCISGGGEKRIVSVRNKESLFAKSIWKKLYVQFSYCNCSGIVAVSDIVRKDVISYFGVDEKKVVVIPNCASEIEAFTPVSDEFSEFAHGRKTFINVGRLKPEKGQIHLIRAFSIIAAAHPDICLVILGEGPLRPILEDEIIRLHLTKQVKLEGYHSRVSDYMRCTDFFVLSSNIEGMPNVIIEALQVGLPVVSTECGAREILNPKGKDEISEKEITIGEYGILTPVCGCETTCKEVESLVVDEMISEQERLLAEAMERMLTDDQLQQRYKACQQEAIRRFHIHEIADKWSNIF